jgi:hypothetical protein
MLDETREAVAILPENDYTTALNGITDYLDTLLDGCKA